MPSSPPKHNPPKRTPADHQAFRLADRDRGTAAERGYDHRWREARERFLAEHPICECPECKATGRVTEATIVDHIRPHRGDPVLFWDESNWQAMSKPHHDAKTARGE